MTPRKMYVLNNISLVVFFLSIALFVVACAVSPKGTDLDTAGLFRLLDLILSIAISGTGLLISTSNWKIICLVVDWKKVTGYEAKFFPQNKADCEELGGTYFPEYLRNSAYNANIKFGERDFQKGLLENHAKKTPVYSATNKNKYPSDLPALRENHRLALKSHKDELMKLGLSYRNAEADAKYAHKNYLAWWDFLKGLGAYYEINLLPIDPETEKTYEDPTKYRGDVAQDEVKKLRELTGFAEEIPAQEKLENSGEAGGVGGVILS